MHPQKRHTPKTVSTRCACPFSLAYSWRVYKDAFLLVLLPQQTSIMVWNVPTKSPRSTHTCRTGGPARFSKKALAFAMDGFGTVGLFLWVKGGVMSTVTSHGWLNPSSARLEVLRAQTISLGHLRASGGYVRIRDWLYAPFVHPCARDLLSTGISSTCQFFGQRAEASNGEYQLAEKETAIVCLRCP
jgi:hypothetical protein